MAGGNAQIHCQGLNPNHPRDANFLRGPGVAALFKARIWCDGPVHPRFCKRGYRRRDLLSRKNFQTCLGNLSCHIVALSSQYMAVITWAKPGRATAKENLT